MIDNEQVILTAMKKEGKPMRPADIAKSAALDKELVSKTLKDLKKKGMVQSPKACFYSPVEK